MTNSNRRMCWTILAITVLTLIIGTWFLHHKQPTFLLLQPTKCPISSTSPTWTVPLEAMTSEDIFNYLHWTNSTSCQLAVDFGFWIYSGSGISAPDGHKAVCLDPDVGPVYNHCLVYSFGINNQWAFDQAMAEFGCQVYSFDPSMGVGNHNRSGKIHFYNIGLDGEDRVHPETNWQMKTATSIYRMLSPLHGETIIDVFKMDIEFSEWRVIPQMIRSGFLSRTVKQMAVEIHFSADDSLETFRQRVGILQKLESSLSSETGGFVRFSSRPNPWLRRPIPILNGKNNYIGYELAWYNSRYYKHNGHDEIELKIW